MAKNYDKEQLIADWKAGGYSLQKLADKYLISKSMVAKLTRGIDKDLKPIVDSVINEIKEKVHGKSVQEVHAVTNEVVAKTKHLEFIHNSTLKNASVMMEKVDTSTTHQEHKFVQETLEKAGQTLGVIDKGNTVINNNNTNAQQNNTSNLTEQEIDDKLSKFII